MNFSSASLHFEYRPSSDKEAMAMLEWAKKEQDFDEHNAKEFERMEKEHLGIGKTKSFLARVKSNAKDTASSIKSLKSPKLKFYSYGVSRPHLL